MTFDVRPPAAGNANHVLDGVPVALRLVGAAALGLMAVLATSLLPGAAPGPAAAVLAGAVLLAVRGLAAHPHDRLGTGNLATLTRLVLTCLLIALLPLPGGWPVVALAALALALDGVDGWLARREGLASAFGARFDVETDALLSLVLASHAIASGAAGPSVLLLALPYYLFRAAGSVWPWLLRDLPPRIGRKAICVIQIGVLVGVLIPWMPRPAADGLVAAAAALLAWSFWVDVLWLRARRR